MYILLTFVSSKHLASYSSNDRIVIYLIGLFLDDTNSISFNCFK